MFFDLLHFGDGPQALNYFVFCFFAILGTLQIVAAWYVRRDLLWLEGRISYVLGAVLIVGSFIWFFVTDKEIFIPGLAGGELFTIFVAAFVIAVPITRLGALVVRAIQVQPVKPAREKEPTL